MIENVIFITCCYLKYLYLKILLNEYKNKKNYKDSTKYDYNITSSIENVSMR